MALVYSFPPKCTSSSPNLLQAPQRLLGINKYSNNVLANFVYRGPRLAATKLGSSTYPITVKCLKLDVAEQQQISLVDGLEPAVLTPPENVKRADFPPDFKFGASTSALQTEGSGTEGGRGPSTWDFMIQASAGKKGVDSYNLYKEDAKLLKNMGMNAYRFSIAWPRILPNGTEEDGGINQEGVDFYNKFIDELIANGIEPVVTLFHFDLPVALATKYNGFMNEKIVEDFKKYAEICFDKFGDRVKYWSTINEPFVFGSYGYKMGLPADVQNDPMGPYIATHNIILAHAAAAQVYHQKYQKTQNGKIGISLPSKWYEPYSIDPKDVESAKTQLDFMLGWYMDPFVNGDYPSSMKQFIKGLPEFTEDQKKMICTSCDYIGLNYYTARFAKQNCVVDSQSGIITVQFQEDTVDINGNSIGWEAKGQAGIYVHPDGLKNLILHIKEKYKNPEIFVTENGVPSKPTITASIEDSVKQGDVSGLKEAFYDDYRLTHAEDHLISIREAMKQGANVKGYFVWTLMDNMEVGAGYDVRFGLCYTDYYDNHRRYPKKSAMWFNNFLKEEPKQAKKFGIDN